ncbi:thioredoxin-related transmembrane protein 2 homolog [Diachasma alloeum]|uniref:thioredoxin-related transmembrane protein 2 homolog n=1 Tax=Diachasma alloeum TaxID=454923 RepID=UPI0007382F61|nr:thioredoxin-related transmembrane protein 2 homolog [Diachasma alloeum]XP_015114765.1 thioredoxin-related transmembrane protein 2 homolog [Diachasma alloeum]XP_015114766.1 thioredoxin-related transmembrane protein 2 homolog [Diachasma alloeum]
MAFKKDLKLLVKPYYLINILLSLSYMIVKKVTFICEFIFNETDCELEGREMEILFFLVIVISFRTRKAGSVTMINYLSSSFVYTKVANLILWFYADIRCGILFAIIITLCGLVLPEPMYQGPENITYLRGATGLQEELNRDTRIVWIVAFYTAWNPACVNFAPTFSQLSAEYALENFKFGKVDIGRYPDAAAKYHVSDASTSKQLPSILLFKDGKEIERRPYADSKGKLVKFLFSLDNIKAAFDLNNVYKTCKENPIKRKEKKDKKAVKAD